MIITVTIKTETGIRYLEDTRAKNEYDYSKIIKDMQHLEDYWIKGINNTMMISKKDDKE